MHETKSKMYVVPWHHTYSGYATAEMTKLVAVIRKRAIKRNF